MANTAQDSARRIAEKGRETLLARLREAFEEAAAAHAEMLELDEAKLEAMVARAAERADGLQWRRALAAAATEELGIGLGEALGHPAVAEAQRLVGAPSYEEGLAAIADGKAPEPGRPREGGDAESEARGGPRAQDGAETEASGADGGAGGAEPVDARILATYLGGLARLAGAEEVTLAFSQDGLEIVRGQGGDTLARYGWSELRSLQVRRRLLRRSASPRLSIVVGGEEARFEVAGVDGEWLERRLAAAQARIAGDG